MAVIPNEVMTKRRQLQSEFSHNGSYHKQFQKEDFRALSNDIKFIVDGINAGYTNLVQQL
jgi:hypothetical protein